MLNKSIYIYNAKILTSIKDNSFSECMLITDGIITKIGDINSNEIPENCERHNANGNLILPGLINTHVHLSQQLARGIADDVPLLVWLRERIWPYEAKMDAEDSFVSSLACCVELVKSGVTTFCESGGQHVPSMVEAVSIASIRANLCASILEGEELPIEFQKTSTQHIAMQEDLYKKYNGLENNKINIWYGIRTLFNASDELVKATTEAAKNHNTGIHMHGAEIEYENTFVAKRNGFGTIKHMNHLNSLGSNLLIAHAVWLDDEDVELIAKNNVKITHNPSAAMKVTLGFAPITQMFAKNIDVSIGTDGAPSNNRMDITRDMFLTSVIHKGKTLNPETLKAPDILEMLTKKAANCALRGNEIGELSITKHADLIEVELEDIHTIPCLDSIANFVYCGSSNNIKSSMCQGKWLMKNREILTIDEEEIKAKVKTHSKKIWQKIGLIA